jgi:phosphoadenosine phosphosulfate reductase
MERTGLHVSLLTARQVTELDKQFESKKTEEVLEWAANHFGPRAAIGTSFQGAGLVMMHLAKQAGLSFPVFTLDTGLLFPETLKLKQQLEDFYGWKIESVVPDLTVEQQVDAQGPELWTRDPDLCCTMRKVLPLQSRLRDLDCWITGLRRSQSASRATVNIIELYTLDQNAGTDIIKLNPMAKWTRDEIWQYIKDHKIPYNPLHDQGYQSIGCMTCTRKTGDGQGERAGRWIGFKKVECGIHTFMSKKADFQI